jgi:tRNA 2-thiouridine synthesizing protein A
VAALAKENTSTRPEKEPTMSTDLSTIQAEKVVDARGTSCPGPILAAKKGIPGVTVGAIMEVQATDTGTQKDLPAWCKKMGHEFLGVVEEPGYMRLFVKKMR